MVTSRVGQVTLPAEITDKIMAGGFLFPTVGVTTKPARAG